jgi:hypothetical protein
VSGGEVWVERPYARTGDMSSNGTATPVSAGHWQADYAPSIHIAWDLNGAAGINSHLGEMPGLKYTCSPS